MCCKIQYIRQLHTGLINSELIIITNNCRNKAFIKKGVPQNAQISKLEWTFSKISKPAGNRWRTPFSGNSSLSALFDCLDG